MIAHINPVHGKESFEVNDPAPRLLRLIRSRHEAINCNPDRLVEFTRVPGHAIAVMKFSRGAHYVIWFK